MAYENECDAALKLMGTGKRYYNGFSYEEINLGSPDPQTVKTMELLIEFQAESEKHAAIKGAVFAILRAEGFIEKNSKDTLNYTNYFLTDKGKAFLATDSFVERAKRWELESKRKRRELQIMQQEIRLNRFQIKTKGWAFWISACSVLVSIAALIISLAKCDDSNNNHSSSNNQTRITDSLINSKWHSQIVSSVDTISDSAKIPPQKR